MLFILLFTRSEGTSWSRQVSSIHRLLQRLTVLIGQLQFTVENTDNYVRHHRYGRFVLFAYDVTPDPASNKGTTYTRTHTGRQLLTINGNKRTHGVNNNDHEWSERRGGE